MVRKLKGTVVSNKMVKTLIVRVDRLKKHPKYLKYYRVSRKFKTHVDNAAEFRIGDQVVIGETRPISKDKRWKVIEVVKQIPAEEITEDVSGEAVIGP